MSSLYEIRIGLEVHVQINTKSKLFCSCPTLYGQPPNTQTCVVCQGHPGALPVLNQAVIQLGIQAGLALNCTISKFSRFDRKHYFYPDLPKGYQITQYHHPLCFNGWVDIQTNDGTKSISIHHIHLEEDAGKLIHSKQHSLVDLNRAGIPLLEIVSCPNMHSPEEAKTYLLALKSIMRNAKISSCDMEKGELRCDANISLMPKNSSVLGSKVELKNLNSFRNVQKALEYEAYRQTKILSSGTKPIQETRQYDVENDVTRSLRIKDQTHNYLYFPDPDLPPIQLTQESIEQAKSTLPESIQNKAIRFKDTYQLSDKDIQIFMEDNDLAEYFEQAVQHYPNNPKKIANRIQTDLLRFKKREEPFPVPPKDLALLTQKVEEGLISGPIGKSIFEQCIHGKSMKVLLDIHIANAWDSSKTLTLVLEILKQNPKSISLFKQGETKIIGFLIGQALKKSNKQANPTILKQQFLQELNK